VTDMPESADAKLQAGDSFFAGALRRIRRIAVVIGVVAAAIIWFVYGTAIGLGFIVGCAISYVNFLWLERVINELGNRVAETGQTGGGSGIVARFLFRYGFIAIACFVILICFKSSVYGLLGGLFLTVAAILCEAAYEGMAALHWGI